MSCAGVSSARASPNPDITAHAVKDVSRILVIAREDDWAACQLRRGKTLGREWEWVIHTLVQAISLVPVEILCPAAVPRVCRQIGD
jgi:hypothetical protein